MAGDLEYLASLNDAQFQATIKRLDRTIAAEQAKADAKYNKGMSTATGENKWRREFLGTEKIAKAAFYGIGASIGAAVIAMRQFAEQNISAQRSLENLGGAWKQSVSDVGMDLFNLVGPDFWATKIREWNEVRKSIVRSIAEAFADDVPGASLEKTIAEQDKRWKSIEAQQQSAKDMVISAERQAELGALRAQGREQEAEALRISYEYEQKIFKIRRDSTLFPIDRQNLEQRLLDAMDTEIKSATTKKPKWKSMVGNIEPGQGLRFFTAMFGGPRAVANVPEDAQKMTAQNTQNMADTLKRIETKIGGGARFH